MKLIDKDALVAGIERRLEKITNASSENNRELSAIHGAQQYELINLIQYINALEVKDVDLDSEITLWANVIPEIRLDDVERLATYFFELGLKTQKGE